MKKKTFDCVEMNRKGGLNINEKKPKYNFLKYEGDSK